MKLVIVESPTKARTINRFLGKGYQVVASQGHVRDLPKKSLGVEIEKKGRTWHFQPQYELVPGKEKIVRQLVRMAKEAEDIILATDLDREGEAIAWHLAQILAEAKVSEDKLQRVVFHEITAAAIKEAFQKAGKINADLVSAQQARRILDRVVGYKLSPLLWRKIKRGLSAGRVQSVALRLIVEREREIAKFKKGKFWQVWAVLKADGRGKIDARLIRWRAEKVDVRRQRQLFAGRRQLRSTIFGKFARAAEAISGAGKNVRVVSVQERQRQQQPAPPLATASLQQEAARRWSWSPKMTMRVAQALYERGLITYHRTDSLNLSRQFIAAARGQIKEMFGKKYLPPAGRQYKTRAKVAQEAHEAIRPTRAGRQSLAKGDRRQQKLYRLIWQRSLASQMAAAKFMETKADLKDGDLLWRAEGQRLLFDGFLKLYEAPIKEKLLPALQEGQKLDYRYLEAVPQQILPPPRYTEASLVRELEKKGIGRPSTYAPIISLIQERGYVEKTEGRFWATKLGEAISDFLSQHFSKIMSLPFTAQLEAELDEIANGRRFWTETVAGFWGPFIKKVEKTQEKAARVKIEPEKIGEKCPKCGQGELVIRRGKFGKFIACSRFPECDYTRPYVEEAGFNCPECGAPAVIRYTKKRRRFYGCSRYPKCKWASWKKPSTTINKQQTTDN